MIEQQGIQGCRVTGRVTFNANGHIYLPLKNTGPRTCIFGEAHKSNNPYLSVEEGYVYYKCHSEKCEGKQERIMAPQSLLDWCAKSHEVSKRQKTTDPSPVTDTSSGTDLADMSDVDDVIETEDEKEQTLHCDEYNENLAGGVGDGAGVLQKKPGKIDVKEEIVKDDDADVIDAKNIVSDISLYITKFKKERSAMHDTWTKMLLCIMDICRTNNVEKRATFTVCRRE